MQVRLKQTSVNILQNSPWEKALAARQGIVGGHKLFIYMVHVMGLGQIFVNMVTQEFERFLFEIFANPRDEFATNQELSNMEMTARSFEKHVFCFASMKSQQIG